MSTLGWKNVDEITQTVSARPRTGAKILALLCDRDARFERSHTLRKPLVYSVHRWGLDLLYELAFCIVGLILKIYWIQRMTAQGCYGVIVSNTSSLSALASINIGATSDY